jgi:uncharacterized membrane protein
MRSSNPHSTNHSRASRRSGAAALWTLIVVPALVGGLLFVADAGRIWLARIELQSALEGAALAGVQTYRATGNASQARTVTQQYAAGNLAGGVPVTLALNGGNVATGNILSGSITGADANLQFNLSGNPNCGATDFGIGAQAAHPFPSLFASFLGQTFGPYTVRGRAFARDSCATNLRQAVRIASVNP